MFDWLYRLWVNSRTVRLLYGLGFFLFWASWAKQSLDANDVTWLVFGWLPAVFWPIQAVVRLDIPTLSDIWNSPYHFIVLGRSFNWGALVIIVIALGIFASDIRDWLRSRGADDEPATSPAA
jgi:hypothetical protein